jgi:hypothetical protein
MGPETKKDCADEDQQHSGLENHSYALWGLCYTTRTGTISIFYGLEGVLEHRDNEPHILHLGYSYTTGYYTATKRRQGKVWLELLDLNHSIVHSEHIEPYCTSSNGKGRPKMMSCFQLAYCTRTMFGNCLTFFCLKDSSRVGVETAEITGKLHKRIDIFEKRTDRSWLTGTHYLTWLCGRLNSISISSSLI